MKESITEIRASISSGDLSPTFILEELLDRIDRFDPKIRSYVTINQKATEEARSAEIKIREGKKLGPLCGIPVSVKDLIDTAGLRTTYGNDLFSSNIPVKNSDRVKL